MGCVCVWCFREQYEDDNDENLTEQDLRLPSRLLGAVAPNPTPPITPLAPTDTGGEASSMHARALPEETLPRTQ